MKNILFWAILFSFSSSLPAALCELSIVQEKSQLPNDPRKLYIDLLKKAVANTIYDDKPARQDGHDCPDTAHTMVGMIRLNNIEECMRNIIENNIPGDCVETGVWRGGSTILMRGILQAYSITDRSVWVCDSFQSLPPPNLDKYPADVGLNLYLDPLLAISIENVKNNFSKYGLLDDQVKFLKGFFKDTLPNAPIKQIALLRLDGDLYESTMDSLVSLYPKLSVGGYIIIDDLCIPACVKAVHDYRLAHGITTPLVKIDWTGSYWQKQ